MKTIVLLPIYFSNPSPPQTWEWQIIEILLSLLLLALYNFHEGGYIFKHIKLKDHIQAEKANCNKKIKMKKKLNICPELHLSSTKKILWKPQ
jgi:hypothetical protein